MPGPVGYAAALVQVLSRWTWPVSRIQVDTGNGSYRDVYEGPLLLVSIGNGVRSGGLFFLTPDASLVDGQFDVCVIERLPFRKIIRYFPRVLRGTLQGVREVRLGRGYGARIECPTGLPVHADGEPVGGSVDRGTVRLDIALRPGAFRLFVPPTFDQRTR
jgi:diacylglycerol kinase (ATP)